MTNNIRVSGLAAASALMMLASLPAYSADVTPLLSISDGTSTVTVNSAGTYVCNGTCTNTGITVSTPGSITFSGTVGNFTIVTAQGNSNSGQTSTTVGPAMDIGIGTLINGGSSTGTLTVIWTDVGFSGISPTTITPLTNYQSGTGTTSVYMYVDNSNNDYQGIASGSSTLSASATGLTGPTNPISGSGISANPFGITLKEVITLSGGGLYSNDFGATASAGTIAVVTPPPPPPTPVPSLLLSKCVTTNGTSCVTGSTSVAPFTKVTYLYTVKNTSTYTTSPVTGIKITDDNATPDYTADDFTVCTVSSLAPGASTTCTASVYPPISEGANDQNGGSFNYANYHPGGTLVCRIVDSNGNLIVNGGSGNLEFHWLVDQGTTDNDYGSGATADWPSGSAFSWLTSGNAEAEFEVYDSKGNLCVNVLHQYLNNSTSYISGWGNGGVVFGSGTQWVLSSDTSLSRCLNKNKATAQCTSNSPTTSSEWTKQCVYIERISASCWGSNGFGSVQCPILVNGGNKTGKCGYHVNAPVNSTATNTAVAAGVFAGATVTSNKATATVSIVSTPTAECQVPLETKCNVYGKAPVNCKPAAGGHDGNGYAYCDALLPKTITCNGAQFQLGSASDRCATSSQTIPLPQTKCSSVKFLGSGVNGAQYNQPFTITYTDGSSSTVYQNLSDWCTPNNFSGESVAANMPYRITPNGSQQYGNINLYAYSIPCNSSKTVASITCPNNRNVIVHAVTTCP